ncbi:ketoacyl-synt-domain-containing protein [Xylariaceae sp. FL0016]|nr:ketoacyl-synt-domain-containing protein [Xylariaceae sp. FL0016]
MDDSTSQSDVLLFSSQGSSSHFTVDVLANLEKHDPRIKVEAQDFLRRCHKALHDEFESLDTEEKESLGSWIFSQMDRPETLIRPPPMCQSHPVIESTTFHVHQVLDLILYRYKEQATTIAEAAGVCSGMLPAVLVAASFSTHDEFLECAVEIFRVAFWIGLRTHLFCIRRSKHKSLAPWTLTVSGSTFREIQDPVAQYNLHSSPEIPLRISALFADDLVSLSGPASTLAEFKKLLPKGASARYPHIHGYFHGVANDVQRRGIMFLDWKQLQIPIRSAATGEILRPDRPLLTTVLEHILVHMVDWRTAWNRLYHDTLSTKTKLDKRVVLLGPNTSCLRLASRDLSKKSKLDFVTTSSFDATPYGTDDIAIIHPSRFDNSLYYRPAGSRSKSERSMSVKHGNFLEDAFGFDNAFFNVSPREARSMDPQQRLLLHGSFEALEDAGYVPDSTPSFQKDTFGVFVGVATGDYVDNLRDQPDVYYSPGTLRAFLSGKISYAFGFKGPSMVIDTACSSSLVSIYQACRALRSGDCAAALAGGINVISSPDMYLGLARAHFLSPTGQCKPFDEGADGYCRSEGCGVVVLKRLSKAIAENDRILGVIRGIDVNQCGDAKSITHPDHNAQSALLKRIIRQSRVSPDMISVVEAHGTGTQAGDTAETRSLKSVFAAPRTSENPLYLCAVKGNVGHAEAASGMVGLAKLIVMMKNQQIPPQVSLARLNRHLDLVSDDNVVVPTHLQPWAIPKRSRRLALLNNFGAAGSNAALLLEDAPKRRQGPRRTKERSSHVLTISARTNTAMEALRQRFLSFLHTKPTGLNLSDLCYSASARRMEHDSYRLAVCGSTIDEISSQLRNAEVVTRQKGAKRRTVFVFSGQGGVHRGMGSELLTADVQFANTIRESDNILESHGFPKTWPYLSGQAEQDKDGDHGHRLSIVVEQCACYVLEYALALMFIRWGVSPDLVIGHSLGEYAALTIAGSMTSSDALLLVARRADLMGRMCERDTSGMLSCQIASDSAQKLMSSHSELSSLSIACENGPESTVVGGDIDQLKALAELCKSTDVKSTMLRVPFAFHTSAMDPMMERFSDLLQSVSLAPPSIPVGSSHYGRVLRPGERFDSSYLAAHCRHPIQFKHLSQAIATTMCGPDVTTTLMEMGPSSTTISMMGWAFPRGPTHFIPSLHPRESAWSTLSAALKTLYLKSYAIKWHSVYEGSGANFVDFLPRYPWNKSTFVVPYVERVADQLSESHRPRIDSQVQGLDYDLLGSIVRKKDNETEFLACSTALSPFIKAHMVGDVALCPASVYVELAMEAIDALEARGAETKASRPMFRRLTDIVFRGPLTYSDTEPPEVRMLLREDQLETQATYTFECTSQRGGVHCTGKLADVSTSTMKDLQQRKTAYAYRQKSSVFGNGHERLERFSAKTIYDVIFPRVVLYSSPLKTLKYLQVSPSGLEGFGALELPPRTPGQQMITHPALVDTLLHAAGFIANANAEVATAYICSSVELVMLPTESRDLHLKQLDVYCSLVDIGHSIVADAYLLDGDSVIGWVEGMNFKKLPLLSFKAQLAKLSGSSSQPPHRNATSRLRNQDRAYSYAPRREQRLVDRDANVTPDLYAMIRQICGLNEEIALSPSTDLPSLGIDSLLLIELGTALAERLNLPGSAISSLEACHTVGSIEQVIHASKPTSPPSDESDVADLTGSNSADDSSTDTEPAIVTPPRFDGLEVVFQDIFGLNIASVDKGATLSSLGVDSLGSMELAEALADHFGVEGLGEGHYDIADLTIERLEELVNPTVAKLTSSRPTDARKDTLQRGLITSEPVVRAWDEDSPGFPVKLGRHVEGNVPLYLFHDGSGKCSMYSRLDLPKYNLFGIPSLDFGAQDPSITKMEDLAALYIAKARLAAKKDIVLGGWSFGGVLAFEVARQLRDRGHDRPRVHGVLLLDSPFPLGHAPLPAAVIAHVAGQISRASASTQASLRAQFERHAAMLQDYEPDVPSSSSSPGSGIPCFAVHCMRAFDTQKLCGVSYPWLSSVQHRREGVEAWSGLAGRPVPILELDCHHFEVFEAEHIAQTSKCTRLALAEIERIRD